MRNKVLTNEEGGNVLSFFNVAYLDYLASRQLLMKDLILQGTILANTALEKYFKALKLILNEPIPHHHDITTKKIQNTLKNKYPVLYSKINGDFLTLLSKAYELRYFDEIDAGFNIVLVRGKILAELDFVVGEIENGFRIENTKNRNLDRKYFSAKKEKNPLLFDFNWYLLDYSKTKLIEQIDIVYEFRKTENNGILEFMYWAENIKDDDEFLYEGVKPNANEGDSSYYTCFKIANK